jgi:heat shock protein HslJ
MRTFRKLIAMAVLGLVGLALLTGCGGATTPDGTTGAVNVKQDPALLEAANWTATEIRDGSGALAPVVADSQVTAIFKLGDVAGNASINRYTATYTTSTDDSLIFAVGATTQMAGPENLMTQEANYLKALADTKTYRVSAEKLELFDSSGKPTATFAGSKRTSLTVQTWYCNGYNNGKGGFVSMADTTPVTAVFAEGGTLSGNGGVNQYNTTFVAAENKMTIAPEIVSTKMAGPENLMTQEQLYLAALPTTTRYEITHPVER